jgi:protoporphyrinogen oxidase
MSGRPFYSGGPQPGRLGRRAFLIRAGFATGAILLNGCIRKVIGPKAAYAHIKGKLNGPNAKAGHVLRDKTPLPEPSSQINIKTLIIGGGISGLSAARWLLKSGYQDFKLLELEDHAGGNAFFGTNAVSSYPLGAHYIPIVNNEDQLLVDFLHEQQVITHFDENNLPFYNEYYLCFDPEERLLINGHWQEGIVPDFGVPQQERQQIVRFFNIVTQFKRARGNDGKFAFDIPIDNSSADETYRKLDEISFIEYLKNNGFDSPYLLWYLNYCCKDDYGTKADKISAWAGIHYFASRRGKAANAAENSVITWPEGNGWLMKKLRETVKDHIYTSHMAYDVSLNESGNVSVKVIDLKKQTTTLINAENVIMASPQFVNAKLLKNIVRPGFDFGKMHYSPWLIANITVNNLPTSAKGMVLCWDNVAYGTPSVGYVNANQQDLKVIEEKKVLTYYLPLCEADPAISRIAAYARTYDQWLDIVIPEMERMHPEITPHIGEVEFWLWGHGMIAPVVGYIWGDSRRNAGANINKNIFFAHTDLSGISIFEEAFHQGINAAQQLLNSQHAS